ncbi:MAG: hypothetical protein HN348_07980, partial [Proteobacteria bacterium]|nr:hypothetical protein [Pseudomonadota bacterium]
MMLLFLALSCALSAPPMPAPDAGDSVDEPPMTGVTVEMGQHEAATVVGMEEAWIDDDGSGKGNRPHGEVAGPPRLVITGQTVEWSLKEGVVVFDGQVEAVRDTVVLRCGRLEVTYRGDRVERATARGGVEVIKGDRLAMGESAILTVDDGRLELSGGVSLREGPHELTG